MASAYKSALRSNGGIDSDDEISSTSDASTSTMQGDVSEGDASDTAADVDFAVNTHSATTQANRSSGLRNRVLMLTSRGVSHRHRHLLTDLHALLPHTYKDTKLDTKSSNNYNSALNALADLHSCNYVFFLEARKQGQDLYLWLAKAPNGPTIKFSVSNVHTMGELGFGGNCLKGGRGLVVFDKSFEDGMAGMEHKSLIREMLRGVFCVPQKGVRGMKPFVDRIIGIYGLDGKIWIRIYEIREGQQTDKTGDVEKGSHEISLVEVGPRLVLTPIVILEGSFGGPVIFENKQFVSPNQLRSEARLRKAGRFARRKDGAEERTIKRKSLGLESGVKRKPSVLDNTALFG